MSRDWMMTYSGRHVRPLNVDAALVSIYDIGHSLGMQCRYGGHTRNFYSVGEHSFHIAEALRRDGYSDMVQLQGLFHDSPEAYMHDFIKPLKDQIRSWIDPIEEKNAMAIFEAVGIDWPMDPIVDEYDKRIVADEKDCPLLFGDHQPWDYGKEPLGIDIKCWPPEIAKVHFINRARALTYAVAVERV